ncbi:MAG: sigma-70 family RNA polymerase sigma factor [Wenzhouxiangella sp.]|nr:MAG: sigma-70 family RNA polymerase sigma factor [Wenzhouxiangella sp.]
MKEADQHQVTQLLAHLGDSPDALDRLARLVYDDIHRLARHQRQGFKGGETLRTTALVHEAFLKVFRHEGTEINDRSHLMRVMAMAMRQIIVDHARRHLAEKRGGDAIHVELDEQSVGDERMDAERILDVENAIIRLGETDDALAELVAARFYGGLTTDDIASMQGVSRRTVQRQLKRANAWLRFELQGKSA